MNRYQKKAGSLPPVISYYHIDMDHTIDWENTQILDVEPSYFKSSILEMVHIKWQPSPLNKQIDTKHLPDEHIHVLTLLSNT